MQNVTVADLSTVVKLVEKIEIHKGSDPFNLDASETSIVKSTLIHFLRTWWFDPDKE